MHKGKSYSNIKKDRYVDASKQDDFLFNRTPILASALHKLKNTSSKNPGQSVKTIQDSRQSKVIDVEDEEIQQFSQPTKRVKKNPENIPQGPNFAFLPLQKDLFSFYTINKISLKAMESVPLPKFQIGSLILTSICDRGIGGKFLVTNLFRNKKGYIDYKQVSQIKAKTEKDSFESIQTYREPGQFVICSVVKGLNSHHLQLSLSKYIQDMDPKSFRINQVLPAQIKSKQQLGCHMIVSGCSKYKFFLPKSDISDEIYEKLSEKKQLIVGVQHIDHTHHLIKVRMMSSYTYQQQQKQRLSSVALNLRGIEEQQLSKYQLQQYVSPGTLVNTKIVKILSNGIMVKFLKIFIGFVHFDHLNNSIGSYKVDEKLLLRIIYACANPPLIYLSQRHCSLHLYKPKYSLYSAVKKPDHIDQVQNSFLNVKEQFYLHPTQMHSEIENIGKLWVKQFNFFERYQIMTTRKLGVRVGELTKEIPFSNFKIFSNNNQTTANKKFKVMCIDVWNKVVKVSYDDKIVKSNSLLFDTETIDLENQTEISKQYCGFVSSVNDNGIVVEFCNNIKGTIPKNQIKMSGMNMDQQWKGKGIDVYIANIKGKNGFITLSILPPASRKKSKFSGDKSKNDQSKGDHKNVEQTLTGTIVSIVPNSINPIYVKLRENIIVKISIFKGIRPASMNNLPIIQNLEEHFQIGQSIRIFRKNKDYFLYPPEQLSDKNLRICKVVGQKNSYVRLQTNKNEFYSCHICDVTDLIIPHPFSTLKLGQYRIGRVLDNNMICLRNSIIVHGLPKSVLDCKQKYGSDELRGDYRNRILTVGSSGLKEDMIIFGYVKQFTEKGCFVSVSNDYEVRIQRSELNDLQIQGDQSKFYPQNKLMLCRLISEKVKPNDPTKHLFDASARESVVKLGYPLNDDLLQVGLSVSGYITGYSKGKSLVRLCGSKFTGILHPNEVPNIDPELPIEKSLPIGKFFNQNLKIIEINNDGRRLIRLSCQPKYLNKYKDIDINLTPEERVINLYESYTQMLKEKAPETVIMREVEEEQQNQIDSQDQYNRIKALLAEENEDGEGEMQQQPIIQNEQNIMEEESIQEDENPDQDYHEPELDEQDSDEQIIENKAVNNQNAARILSQFNELPHSEQAYQSIILANNTPQSHIQYISSMINKCSPTDIRAQLVRSIAMLEGIKEKQNLWITWLNIQTILGDLPQTVKKAIQANVGVPVYARILQIFREQDKWELAREIGRKMLKKYNKDIKAYLVMLRHSLLEALNQKQDQKASFKDIVRRAKQCLKSSDIIQIQSQYAKILYEQKQAEKARTIFGDILLNHPKRTDLWSMYVDLEIKHGAIDKARQILERSLTIPLKKKKLITILKKYYKIEQEYGTPESANEILERAKNLAEEYAENQEENDSEQDN